MQTASKRFSLKILSKILQNFHFLVSPFTIYHVNMEEIYNTLMSCLPPPYVLEWNKNPLQPIRYRINTTKDQAEVYNFLWSESITKCTGVQSFSNDKSIRFTIPFQQTNISISIFPSTGTVMLQGNSSPLWANIHMPKICSHVKNDEKGYLKSISCIVCGGDSNNAMVVCDNEHCMSWTHHECAGTTEESVRSSYWCKICVDKYVENQNSNEEQQLDPNPLNLTTSTPNKTTTIDSISLTSKDDLSRIFNSTSLSDLQLPGKSILTEEQSLQNLSN